MNLKRTSRVLKGHIITFHFYLILSLFLPFQLLCHIYSLWLIKIHRNFKVSYSSFSPLSKLFPPKNTSVRVRVTYLVGFMYSYSHKALSNRKEEWWKSLFLSSRITDIDKPCHGAMKHTISQKSFKMSGIQTLCEVICCC